MKGITRLALQFVLVLHDRGAKMPSRPSHRRSPRPEYLQSESRPPGVRGVPSPPAIGLAGIVRCPFPDREALSTTNVPKTTLAAPKRAYAPASPYPSLQSVPCCQRHADDRNGRLKDRRRGASAPTSPSRRGWLTSSSRARRRRNAWPSWSGPRIAAPRTREHGGHECPGHHGDPRQNR